MDAYTVDDLRRDLEPRLAPHSITLGLVLTTEQELIIETHRTNGTEVTKLFTFPVTRLWPATALRLAIVIRDWYASQP